MLSCSFGVKSAANALGIVPPTAGRLSGGFSAKSAADPLMALFHLQRVCYLVLLVQNQLLTLL
jgi:hypothetical protein